MSCDAGVISVSFLANQTNELLARATARQGTGAATGVSGEGNFLQIANIQTITRKVWNLSTDPERSGTPDSTTSITIADTILDTVQTSSAVWTKDTIGYNFIDPVPYTAITQAGDKYGVDYDLVLIAGLGSGRGRIRFEGKAS